MKTCPNKNDIRWKRLEAQCGKELATTIYMTYGESFPKVLTITELKNDIKLPSKAFISDLPKLKKRIRLYNQKNGTSHTFKEEHVGQSQIVKLTLNPNYLPVNLEKQRLRDRARLEDLTYLESFEETYGFNPKEVSVNREEFLQDPYLVEQERKEFDYEPEVQAKISYTQSLKERLKTIDSQLASAQASQNTRLYERLLKVRKETKDRIEESENKINFQLISNHWDRDLSFINSLLSSPTISEADVNLLYKILSYYSNRDFLTEYISELDIEAESPSLQRADIIVGQASRYISRLNKLSEKLIKARLERITGKDYSNEKINELTEIGVLSANFRDTSTNSNILIQLGDSLIKQSGNRTNKNLSILYKKIEKAAENIKDFGIFLQKNEKGIPTGKLVHPYSQKFFDALITRAKVFNSSKSKAAYDNFINWKKDNVIEVDWRKLFYSDYKEMFGETNFTQEEIDFHINSIKSLIGDKAWNKLKDKLERKKNIFLSRRQFIQENVDLNGYPSSYLRVWDMANSPFTYFDNLNDPPIIEDKVATFDFVTNKGYIPSIPLKTKDGKNLGYYDAQYEQIANDAELLEFFEMFSETISEMLAYVPSFMKKGVTENFIPFLMKSVFEKITESNGSTAFKDVYEGILKGIRDSEESEISFEERDPLTNKPIPSLKVSMMSGELSASEKVELLQKLEEQDLKPGDPLYKKVSDEIKRDILNRKRSYDLPKILKAFVTVVETYRHKAEVEDSIKMIDYFIKSSQEVQTTASGKTLKDAEGNVIKTKDTFKNVLSQWEYAYDAFYGLYKDRKLSAKKILTSEEKEKIKYLENKIQTITDSDLEEDVKEKELEKYNKLLNAIGGYRVNSEIWDSVMKYIHVKSMGWNVFSAANNFMVGTISNIIYAQGNQEFGTKEYFKALSLMKSSFFKAATFDTYQDATNKKIRNLIEYYSVMGTAADELNQSNFYKSSLGKGINKLMPYELTKSVEYINQGTTFIAMLLKEKIDTPEGEKSLWECYDEDGQFKYGDDTETYDKFKGKLAQTMKAIHGNYDPLSPVKIKKTVGGRAIMMFRNWIAETVANRWEEERDDIQLGRKVKGRWRSYEASFNAEHLKDASVVEKAIFVFQSLTSKAAREKLSDLDAANMRKNAAELVLWISVSLAMFLLSAGDDDDDEKNSAMKNYVTNLGFRLQTDIEFYISPIAAEKLLQQSVPPAQIVVDLAKFTKAIKTYVEGEDIIERGPYSGQSRLERSFGRLIPGWATYYRQLDVSSKINK
jgi:hypothetical protein